MLALVGSPGGVSLVKVLVDHTARTGRMGKVP